MTHLHLVREVAPERAQEKGMLVFEAWCPGCEEDVFLIHFGRPGEDSAEE